MLSPHVQGIITVAEQPGFFPEVTSPAHARKLVGGRAVTAWRCLGQLLPPLRGWGHSFGL